ncbi:hypothetical protein EIN_524000 [Entamoeba invadens IP1]|uniref:Leucine rich repeat containing protein BspA family protein n=1 Tax=Entamoeba invadens IP1 TaxID=370355 RepID=A0A0A1UBC2_ENTIV|nr:hypothetical protein EIN_524000 [Entamoeba invadens IP1]ELP92492.1 hypothetical protein EIN_524000 [Entamoeba invadens IP1]|eukprot:XP_004259263.1 hypothetical protein EIN_524000 [Entamoeba invadens IP1]
MSQIDGYHMMVVSKYFSTFQDFITLQIVCKKYQNNMEKFHFNPIPLTFKIQKYFPNIETLHLWSVSDETFHNIIIKKEERYINETPRHFFCIIVWYKVSYEDAQINTTDTILFKNVVFTQRDREIYGTTVLNTAKPQICSLGDLAFSYSNITEFQIPLQITSIGHSCFSYCKELKKFSFLENKYIKTINTELLFCGCTNLSSVDIAECVSELKEECFSKCISLSHIILPRSVTSLGNKCFFRCSKLTQINILESVVSIGSACFDQCEALNEIDIPKSVIELKEKTLYGCYKMSRVVLHEGLTLLGKYCFNACMQLEGIVLPQSLVSINSFCFNCCSQLKLIQIPNNVKSIGEACFAYCEELREVTLPETLNDISDACFAYCKQLTQINIPKRVTKIGECCFYNCKALKTLVVPWGVTVYGQFCFDEGIMIIKS